MCKAIEYLEDWLLLQKDLDSISKWAKNWQLQLNLVKTDNLTIGIDRFPFQYTLYTGVVQFLNRFESMCDLGAGYL